jgi:hypothetical protein
MQFRRSVTHVAGRFCYLCPRPHNQPQRMPRGRLSPIIVYRRDVERADCTPLLRRLRQEISTPSRMRAAFGRVAVLFDGYGNDARPLWDVPEVRAFVAAVDADFPHWCFVADLKSPTLHLVAACLFTIGTPVEGAVKLDTPRLKSFIERGAHDTLLLCSECGIDESVAVTRMGHVIDYYEGLRIYLA